ncbi:hypothetical protein [Hymenobacter cellulosilyticus]|uniref:Glyoxalase n=1 Tax=Hymenobacter cellulosilyticus TaxID=2932248 RepID=A0A8T9QAW8_9BACT|nr:hypothetical protein [Hymenobacter cellulosilyticus]UOQ72669.1 hypothetical protein MUN79_01345 [Hymenobacter cellulosilyticus]
MAPELPTSSDTALLALRPTLPTALTAEPEATAGDFLHRTLRPVLKLQNDLLLQLVADFVREHHVAFLTRSPADQLRTLAELLGRNVKLRYTIIGVVIGLFTRAEQAFYRQHRSEVNRRLMELATQRVQSQLPELAALLTTSGAA